MDIVIKPVKKPPKLKDNDCLSTAAQETLKAIEEKYNALSVSMFSANRFSYNRHHNNDPANYYKRIYENTFKKELISQPPEMSFGQETSSSNQSYPWQTTHFKETNIGHNKRTWNLASGCIQENCEKTLSSAEPFIESPLIELDIDDSSRHRDHHHHMRQREKSVTCPQSETQDLQFTQKKTDARNSLLMKWNRKFSQIASQFDGKSEKSMTENNINIQSFDSERNWKDVHNDSELMWIDNLRTQTDKNDSNSGSCDISSPLCGFGNENMKGLSSSEDPFNVFSLTDQDMENCISVMEKKEHNVPEISNSSLNSKSSCDEMEFMENGNCDQPHLSEEPVDVNKATNMSSSIEINEEKLYKESDSSENLKHSFSNRHLQRVDKSRSKSSNEKQRHFQAVGTPEDADIVIPEKRKRTTCENLSKKRLAPQAKEDPQSDPKTDVKNERKGDDDSAKQKLLKRFKSGFKPPTKDHSESHNKTYQVNKFKGKKIKTVEPSREAQPGLPNVVDYFSLTNEMQHKVAGEISSAQHIALTLVISNGNAVVNHFDSGLDCTKDPSVVLLTEGYKCYQLTINADNREIAKKILFQILCNGECEITVPNSKEFLSALYKIFHVDANYMISCETLEDPVLASWLLNPDKPPTSFSMICQTAHLKYTGDENDWLSCLCFTKKLMDSLSKLLEGDNLMKLYKDIEIKLVPLLARMENQSLKIKIEIFRKFAEILKSKLHKLEESAYKEVGHKFTINSHPQLRQILYEELKLDEKLPPTAKIGKTSVSHLKSTCESSLLLLAGLHPLPTIILEYRSLQKLKSTYIDGMLSCMSNNSITTHWDQTSAATGRITSYQPNIQNIPKTVVVVEDYLPNTILGSAPKSSAQIYAREPFICHEGFVFLAADFQQIELRILAHLSEDKALLSMFWNPDSIDIFTLLTAEWKSIDADNVSNEERETTKRVVYSVMYGVGKEKLAVYLKVKPDIAKEIMKNFLARFPAIDSFTKKCCSYAKEYGYTETICGRRRYFPYINSNSPALRAQAQRQAVNFCVQGSAADICKLAMLEVESSLKKRPELNCRLLLQIHDELLWEVAKDQLLQVKEIIENVMENAKMLCHKFCSLQVPLSVSFSQGQSWAHLISMNTMKHNEDCQSPAFVQ